MLVSGNMTPHNLFIYMFYSIKYGIITYLQRIDNDWEEGGGGGNSSKAIKFTESAAF